MIATVPDSAAHADRRLTHREEFRVLRGKLVLIMQPLSELPWNIGFDNIRAASENTPVIFLERFPLVVITGSPFLVQVA